MLSVGFRGFHLVSLDSEEFQSSLPMVQSMVDFLCNDSGKKSSNESPKCYLPTLFILGRGHGFRFGQKVELELNSWVTKNPPGIVEFFEGSTSIPSKGRQLTEMQAWAVERALAKKKLSEVSRLNLGGFHGYF